MRLACEDDYQTVLDMSKGHFRGHDSTPSQFQAWLKQKDHAVFMATINGRAIGMCATHLVHDGTTFNTKGLRVHPRYRGRGYGTQFILAIRQIMCRNYPSVLRERYVTGARNVQRIAIARKSGDQLLRRIDSYAFLVNQKTFDFSKLGEPNQSPMMSRIRPCTTEELKVFFSTPNERLFKRGIMVLHSKAYKLNASNVDVISEDNFYRMFCSGADSVLNHLESFSHGVKFEMPKLPCYRVSIFADDPEVFLVHMTEQLRSACRLMDGEFYFRVSHDEDSMLKRNGLEFLESKLGLERETEWVYTSNDDYKSLVFESEGLQRHSYSTSDFSNWK